MDEKNLNEQTTEQQVAQPQPEEVIEDAKVAERLRKYREAEAKKAEKEAEAQRKQAEKEAAQRVKLAEDMEKHYARKAKLDAWKQERDAKRIERDRLEKEKIEAKKEAKRIYYTQDELVPLLANRNNVILQAQLDAAVVQNAQEPVVAQADTKEVEEN